MIKVSPKVNLILAIPERMWIGSQKANINGSFLWVPKDFFEFKESGLFLR